MAKKIEWCTSNSDCFIAENYEDFTEADCLRCRYHKSYESMDITGPYDICYTTLNDNILTEFSE